MLIAVAGSKATQDPKSLLELPMNFPFKPHSWPLSVPLSWSGERSKGDNFSYLPLILPTGTTEPRNSGATRKGNVISLLIIHG